MAFTPAAITTAVAQQLAQVAGIGRVHERPRVMRTEMDVHTHCYVEAQGRLNGWFIGMAAANAMVNDRKGNYSGIGEPGGGLMLSTFQFQIEGYFSLDDAADSYSTFRDLVWAVAFRFNSIGLLTGDCTHQLPADVEAFSFAAFANSMFTHYARLSFGVRGKVL